jgi:hypothetical protein
MRLKQPQHLDVVRGIWLILSVFAWPHDAAQFTNTWLMGVLTVVAALVAMAAPGIRFVNIVAGVWLIIFHDCPAALIGGDDVEQRPGGHRDRDRVTGRCRAASLCA